MTVSATASPNYRSPGEADTAPILRRVPTLDEAPQIADKVDEMVGVGLNVVEIADALNISAYAAFAAGARIRTAADVTAIGATMPPISDARAAELDTEAVAQASMPPAELAVRYGVSLATAERLRIFFATGITRTKPIAGLRQVAEDPAATLANPTVRTKIRACLDDGVELIDIATMVGVAGAELLEALADQDS